MQICCIWVRNRNVAGIHRLWRGSVFFFFYNCISRYFSRSGKHTTLKCDGSWISFLSHPLWPRFYRLSFSTSALLIFWAKLLFVVVGSPGHFRMLGIISGLSHQTPGAILFLKLWQSDMSLDISKCPLGHGRAAENCPLVKDLDSNTTQSRTKLQQR